MEDVVYLYDEKLTGVMYVDVFVRKCGSILGSDTIWYNEADIIFDLDSNIRDLMKTYDLPVQKYKNRFEMNKIIDSKTLYGKERTNYWFFDCDQEFIDREIKEINVRNC